MAISSFIETGAIFDGDTYSIKYFNVSKNFTLLKKGKNTITLSPDFTVVPGSKIEVELFDKNGTAIPVEYPNQITAGRSIILHITIGDNIPSGAAKLFVKGTAFKNVDTGLKLDTSRPNIIWRGLTEIKVVEDSDTPEDKDDLVFDKNYDEIEIHVKKFDFPYRDKTEDRPTSFSGIGVLTYFPTVESNTFSNNIANKPITRTKVGSRPLSTIDDSSNSTTSIGKPVSNTDGLPTIKSTVEEFTSDMIGGKITVTPDVSSIVPPTLTSAIGTVPNFIATIVDVVNSTTIVVDTHFFHTIPNTPSNFVVDSFTSSTYSIGYNKNVSTTEGQKVTGYAQLCFDNVSTSNGKVSKVRVSAKPIGSVGGAMLLGDYDVIPPNKMQDTSSFSFDPKLGLGYKNVGDVTSSIDITNYYDYAEYALNNNVSSTLDTYTYDEVGVGGLSLLSISPPTQRSTNISDAINLDAPIEDSNVVALSVKDEFLGSATAGTTYKISLNAYSENDSTGKQPLAKLFIKGPALQNGGDTANQFGTLVDTIEGGNGQTQKGLEFYFTAETSSNSVKLYIVLETGKWDFSSIKVEPSSETNNSPNEFCTLVPLDNLPINKINEEYVFVVDFIAENGKPTNLNLTTQSITLNVDTTIDESLIINTFNSSTLIQTALSSSGAWTATDGTNSALIEGGNTLTFSEGSVIDLSMDAPNKILTICHGAVCAAGSVTCTPNYYIDGVTLDSFGHVTGLTCSEVLPGGYFWCASDNTTTCQIDCCCTVSIVGDNTTACVSLTGTTFTVCSIQPTVSNSTITICQGGSLAGSFTLNQSSNCTINLSSAGGITITNCENDYVLTATGTSNTINGEANMTFDGITLCVKGSGGVCVTNCVTADNFITTSDRRLKSNIEPIKSGLEVLTKFNSYTYEKNGYIDAGFIAQEVYEAIPYTIKPNKEGYLTMRDRPILAYLHNAVIELNNKIDCLEKKLDS